MQKITIITDESHYWLLLQFLKTLDYVKIVQHSVSRGSTTPAENQPVSAEVNGKSEKTPTPVNNSQLDLLQQHLKRQSRSLFQNIADPVAWQKQQRDEWS